MSSVPGAYSMRSRAALRFIHASDLHLDRPIEGVHEGPAHWEKRLLDISHRAAEQLFQKVLQENVDFLILSGNILNANLAAPGTFLFLLDQFELLRREGINVYWAGGELDSPDDWPTVFPLPENVHHFPSLSIQEHYFHRNEGENAIPMAKIVGMSRNQYRQQIRSSEFPMDPAGLFTIAVTNGQVDPETLSKRRIDYWALGGSDQRYVYHGNPRKRGSDGRAVPLESMESATAGNRGRTDPAPLPYTVHYPGTTAAFSPRHTGTYGATLVEVSPGEDPVLTTLSTSPIRWVNDRITLQNGDDAGKLAEEVRTRIKNYRENQKGEDLMISWYVDLPPGPLAASLRRGKLSTDLLSEFRTLYSNEEPMTWSVSLTPMLPELLPKSFYEQQTILGDFLRSVRHYQDHSTEVIDLESFLPKNWSSLAEQMDVQKEKDALLLADKIELPPDAQVTAATEPNEETAGQEQKGKQLYRYTVSEQQAETRHRVLMEAAMVGIELFGSEQAKFYTMDAAPTPLIESLDESDEI